MVARRKSAFAHPTGPSCEPTGPREARPDDRLREAIQPRRGDSLDCFRLRSSSFGGQVGALRLAMTNLQS